MEPCKEALSSWAKWLVREAKQLRSRRTPAPSTAIEETQGVLAVPVSPAS
jgi:hypothetical protein